MMKFKVKYTDTHIFVSDEKGNEMSFKESANPIEMSARDKAAMMMGYILMNWNHGRRDDEEKDIEYEDLRSDNNMV